ncbi:ABC transporter substrate-binding protein [Rhodococcus fascians]|nr:ABC transporter substrate-binding protein [Rhodococcus fascians]MBY4237880.1 ABC transporter substrate-binding protein [Rhodococcus fascians]MBY4253369.1 ABC transporter substrate-binding protein [Rhodococcus fascians]MBY4269006.1 ABC transporter substrate-binding protein [Rhodococcus fascians]MBY4275059.1 ABC transporter substrate-binding protein [Rhodococcus fascians]
MINRTRPLGRPTTLFAIAVAVTLTMTACGTSDEASGSGGAKIVIAEQSNGGVTTGMLPHLADQLGFFANEGLTVDKYVSVTKGSDAISGLLSGDVQVAHIGADGIVAASQGGPVVGIGANTDASIWTVVASPDVKTWDDLKGKTIALGSVSDITRSVFDRLAGEAGLDPKTDLEYVALGATPQRVAAVQNGQAAATIAAYPPALGVIESGLTDLGFTPSGGSAPILMTTDIEASKRWTESNPDQVTSYLKAIAAAREYVQDPANADDVATRTSEISGESPDAIKRALELYYYDKPADSGLFPKDFHHVEGAFDATVQAYIDLGLLKDSISEDEYMDYSFADQATEDIQ